MPSLGAAAAERFFEELRTQVRRDGEGKMRIGDWVMMLSAADVFIRCGIRSKAAQKICNAEMRVGRQRALEILMEE
jgi:hypothetical protein